MSCWTCHHGKDVPATTIALDNLYGPPNEEKDDIITKDATQPAATAILDKYIAALGGAQKLAGLKSFIATGTQGGYVQSEGRRTIRNLRQGARSTYRARHLQGRPGPRKPSPLL